MSAQIEPAFPLPQAAAKMKVSVEALTRLIDSGTIKANKLANGELVVPESETSVITREQFVELKGKPITMSKASEKYGPSLATIYNWTEHGYIAKLDNAYPVHIDEADVAYCAAMYKEIGGRGRRIFDKDGKPYVLKGSYMASYQRERRKRQKVKSTARPARKARAKIAA